MRLNCLGFLITYKTPISLIYKKQKTQATVRRFAFLKARITNPSDRVNYCINTFDTLPNYQTIHKLILIFLYFF